MLTLCVCTIKARSQPLVATRTSAKRLVRPAPSSTQPGEVWMQIWVLIPGDAQVWGWTTDFCLCDFTRTYASLKWWFPIAACALTFAPIFCNPGIVPTPSQLYDVLRYLMSKCIIIFGFACGQVVMEKRWGKNCVAHSINVRALVF